MHLDEAESDLLRKWIIKKLADISDADPDVLADYVLALSTTDDPEPAAKANCIESLKDFLPDHTETFVDELFQAISTKSFDPSRPPPKPSTQIYQPPKRASTELPRLPNESRKRSYHDWDREEQPYSNGRIQSFESGERPLKQPRRGGRGYEQRRGKYMQQPAHQYGMPSIPSLPTPPPGMPQFDPNNPMAAFVAMQQAMGLFSGMPNGGSPPNANAFAPPQAAQRCRDYDTKGFCAAGASCPYEHGDDPFVVPGFNQEYDPNNATMLHVTPSRIGHVDVSHNDRGRGGPRGRGRGGGSWRGGGKRSDYSHMGPNRDPSITSIVVEQIPEDKCDEQTVRNFFSEFGDIAEVTLEPEKKLAIVKFTTHDAARAAYESPKVVFDNRFVKVYWQKSERQSKSFQDPSNPTRAKSRTLDVEMQDEEQIDPVEVRRRQEEAQRKHDEAKKQREGAAKQREDVDAKLKAMEAERQKMTNLLAKKAGKSGSPATETKENGAEESEQTKALKIQLAKLEAEAESLGIDPNAPTNGFNGYTSYRGRGGFRGRPRGRGFYPSYRGGWSAAGAGRGGAVMRLDNQPKTVAVTFLEGSYDIHDEALRQFLLFSSLDSAALAKHPDRDDTALITFSQRYEAENFMATAANSELLHIGKVELSWYKRENKSSAANGDHEIDTKTSTSEKTVQQDANLRETEDYEAAEDEEDLDRWS